MTFWGDKTTRRDLLWIALLGLCVQAFWAWRLQHPSYFDAYYYTTNAQRLAEGHGFTEEIIWQYLDDPQGLPTPSFTYWMPLPALLGAAGYTLTGTFRGAQLPFWLLAGLLPWLGYAISWRLTRRINSLENSIKAAVTGNPNAVGTSTQLDAGSTDTQAN